MVVICSKLWLALTGAWNSWNICKLTEVWRIWLRISSRWCSTESYQSFPKVVGKGNIPQITLLLTSMVVEIQQCLIAIILCFIWTIYKLNLAEHQLQHEFNEDDEVDEDTHTVVWKDDVGYGASPHAKGVSLVKATKDLSSPSSSKRQSFNKELSKVE